MNRSWSFAEWPTRDRELWLAACQKGDLLADAGSRSGHASSSNQKVMKGYGRWLGWLASQDLLNNGVALDGRITPQRVLAYVAALNQTNSTRSVINLLEDIYAAARTIEAGRDWSWLRSLISRIRARRIPGIRNRDRIVSPIELLELGFELMAKARDEPNILKGAVRFRDGLMIAFLGTRPLRLRNLIGLELHRSFMRRGNTWWIDIPPEETKTRTPIEMPTPEGLTPAIDIYLEKHRPVLSQQRGRWATPVANALWISRDGSPMRDRSVHQQLVNRTKEALGVAVHPHLFRTCVATAVAIEDPEHFAVAARLLAHRGLGTMEKYYDRARSSEAIRRHQELVIRIRDGASERAADKRERT